MKAIDLFAGCGGLSLGFIKDGYTIEKAVEFDETIAKTYKLNHPDINVIVNDIKNVDHGEVFRKNDADVIIGDLLVRGFQWLALEFEMVLWAIPGTFFLSTILMLLKL